MSFKTDEVVNIFYKLHIRATPQRLALYSIFLESKYKHWTAEALYDKLKKHFPSVSLATVYKSLEEFIKKGLVREIRVNFDCSCFEINDMPHHHFFCNNCRKIFDIEIPFCEALKNKEVQGHKIEEFQGYFYGLCNQCRGEKC